MAVVAVSIAITMVWCAVPVTSMMVWSEIPIATMWSEIVSVVWSEISVIVAVWLVTVTFSTVVVAGSVGMSAIPRYHPPLPTCRRPMAPYGVECSSVMMDECEVVR